MKGWDNSIKILWDSFFFQSGKCKIRFARTLSYLMETYFEKVKEYHNGEKPEHGGEGGNSTDKCM